MLATAELILEAAQSDRLAAVLPRYLNEIPLYQAARRRAAVQSHGARLDHLPFITKEDIRRDFPENFLGPNMVLDLLLQSEAVELEHTSGTSEARTPLLLPSRWWGQQERRALELNSLVGQVLAQDPEARRVTLSSPVCSSEICYTGVPTREERVVGNALFLSLSRFPFLWSEAELARMAEEALEWQPRFLDVDPVYGVAFARFCERRGIRFPSVAFVLCSYEFLSVTHRRVLERVFGVPVVDLYGSTETGHLLIQEDSGWMRPSLETAVLEVIASDAPSSIGELVVTTLTNEFMPLVRYRIGDLVERRELPYGTRYRVHGRAADALSGASGVRATVRQLDQCFAGIQGIIHYQILERPEGRCWVRYIPDGVPPSSPDLKELRSRLEQVVQSDRGVELEATDLVMPESSGKFRLCFPDCDRLGHSNVRPEQ
jgi:phenylacetate-CoA ligase